MAAGLPATFPFPFSAAKVLLAHISKYRFILYFHTEQIVLSAYFFAVRIFQIEVFFFLFLLPQFFRLKAFCANTLGGFLEACVNRIYSSQLISVVTLV